MLIFLFFETLQFYLSVFPFLFCLFLQNFTVEVFCRHVRSQPVQPIDYTYQSHNHIAFVLLWSHCEHLLQLWMFRAEVQEEQVQMTLCVQSYQVVEVRNAFELFLHRILHRFATFFIFPICIKNLLF